MRKRGEDKHESTTGKTDPPYQGSNGREIGERLLRCFHVDFDRPPHEDDAFEFHWRCTATFQWDEGDPPYCPYHLPIYTHSGRVSREEAERDQRKIDRYQRQVVERSERLSRPARDEDALTFEDIQRLRRHRDEQMSSAKERGLL